MKSVRIHAAAMLTLLLAAAAVTPGCHDVNWETERQWREGSRGSSPSGPAAADQRVEPSETPASIQSDPPTKPPAETAEPTPITPAFADQPVLRRIRLTNAAGTSPQSELTWTAQLTHAPAPAVAHVLDVLCPAIGTGGGQNQPYVFYQDARTWKLAQDLTGILDHPSLDYEPVDQTVSPGDAFARALGLYYTRWRHTGQVDTDAMARVATLLDSVVESRPTAPLERWASAILACHVRLRFLYDYESARDSARQAVAITEPASLTQLISLYYQVQAQHQLGQKLRARSGAARVVGNFQDYAATEVYNRCRKLAAGQP